MALNRKEARALMDVGISGFVGLLDAETRHIIEQPNMAGLTERDGGDRFARIFLTPAGRNALKEAK